MSNTTDKLELSYIVLLKAIASDLGWEMPIFSRSGGTKHELHFSLRISHAGEKVCISLPVPAGESETDQRVAKERIAKTAAEYLASRMEIKIEDYSGFLIRRYNGWAHYYANMTYGIKYLSGEAHPGDTIGCQPPQFANEGERFYVSLAPLLKQILHKFGVLYMAEYAESTGCNHWQVFAESIGCNHINGRQEGKCRSTARAAEHSLKETVIRKLQLVYRFAVSDFNANAVEACKEACL